MDDCTSAIQWEETGGYMDWVHSRLPGQRDPSEEYEVWLTDGQVRTCRMHGGLYPCMILTDCASPLANAILREDRVMAWRITGRSPQQVAFEGKLKPSQPPVITPGQYQQAGLRNNPMSALYQPRNQFASDAPWR